MSEFQTLYTHVEHEYVPQSVNMLHRLEQQADGWNTRLAVKITRFTGTMWCAYFFTALSLLGLLGLLGWLPPLVFLLATWLSQQFLQLVFLPILSVGQRVLGRHQELQAEEQFQTTIKSSTDIKQIVEHLASQDQELLKHRELLQSLLSLLHDQKMGEKTTKKAGEEEIQNERSSIDYPKKEEEKK